MLAAHEKVGIAGAGEFRIRTEGVDPVHFDALDDDVVEGDEVILIPAFRHDLLDGFAFTVPDLFDLRVHEDSVLVGLVAELFHVDIADIGVDGRIVFQAAVGFILVAPGYIDNAAVVAAFGQVIREEPGMVCRDMVLRDDVLDDIRGHKELAVGAVNAAEAPDIVFPDFGVVAHVSQAGIIRGGSGRVADTQPFPFIRNVGGGITGACLARLLTKDKKKITILDDDLLRCRELMEEFPTARVSYAEGDITEVLEEERVDKADSIVSLTDNDETNLVISMFAWSKGIRSVITRVDRQVHVKLLHKVNIDITVSPTELCVFRLMRFIDRQSGDGSDENAEVMEFIGDLRRF